MKPFVLCLCVLLLLPGNTASPQIPPESDIADVPSELITLGKKMSGRTYYLIKRRDKTTPRKKAFGLLIILPGGHGRGGEFSHFARRIHKYALDQDWIIALGDAKQWTEGQQIVWPTENNTVDGMKHSTEEYVDAIYKDVCKRENIDKHRVLMLGWSSGGPPCYAFSLSGRKYVTGYYILMSVFHKQWLPPLNRARGQRYYIEHGTDDRVCLVGLSRLAKEELSANGADVKYVEYPGGHGFHGPVYPRMKAAIAWLTGR